MDNADKPNKVNYRKAVAELARTSTAAAFGAADAVVPDPTNPYAFVVAHGGKRFRVIVKELE